MNVPIHAAGHVPTPVASLAPPAAPAGRRHDDPWGRERHFAEAEALGHVGSWELDVASGSLWWSDELCRIFGEPEGYRPTLEEFFARVHPEDRAQVERVVSQARGGNRSTSAHRIVRPSGEIRYVSGTRYGRGNDHGEVTHLFGILRDITEQRRAELAHRDAQALFEAAFAQAPIGMALVDLDGRWLKVNQAICLMTGYSEDELLELSFQDVTHPDDLDADLVQIARLLSGEIGGYQIEKRYLTRTGEEIWALLSVSLARDADGTPRHFISQTEDITERKRAEERLRQAELEARRQRDHATAILSAMHEGYALTVGGRIRAVNQALCDLTGFSEEQLVGAGVPFPFWAPERLDETMAVRRNVLDAGGGTFETTFMRRNGERFEAEVTACPARDAAGHLLGFVNTMRDVSVQRRQQRDLEALARTDALTGLANRHVLQEALERAAAHAGRHDEQLALILLDVDWFKQVNDQHGHPVGDAVLVEIAQRLSATARAGEIIARVGGEEFAWLLPGAGPADAVVAANRARRLIAATPFEPAGRLTLSAGVGVMHAPEDGDALYRLADRALYDAKQRGRNLTSCLTAGLPSAEPTGGS